MANQRLHSAVPCRTNFGPGGAPVDTGGRSAETRTGEASQHGSRDVCNRESFGGPVGTVAPTTRSADGSGVRRALRCRVSAPPALRVAAGIAAWRGGVRVVAALAARSSLS